MMPSMCPEVSWRGVSRLILGSKSATRNLLLHQLGAPPFDVVVADIDEDAVARACGAAASAHDLVLRVALAKAVELLKRASVTANHVPLPSSPTTTTTTNSSCDDKEHEREHEHGQGHGPEEEQDEGRVLLIVGDAVVVHKGSVLGKPANIQQAVTYLRDYHKAPLTTTSSVVIVDVRSRTYWAGTDDAEVYFRTIPEPLVQKLAHDPAALQSAGALRIEHPDVQPYVDCVVGDISAVMGFSQPLVASLLSDILADDTDGTPLPSSVPADSLNNNNDDNKRNNNNNIDLSTPPADTATPPTSTSS